MSQVTTRARFCIAVLCVPLTLVLASCETLVNEVRVEPGTTPPPIKPVFVLSDTSGHGPVGTIYGLSVVACGRETVLWQIVATGTNTAPARIDYGVAPAGYIVNIGPTPLSTGCYNVYISDGRRARFHIDGVGRVISDSPRRDTTRGDTSRRRSAPRDTTRR